MIDSVGEYNHNLGQYALAIQHADYRLACRFALRACRRVPYDKTWRMRLWGSFARRHSAGCGSGSRERVPRAVGK